MSNEVINCVSLLTETFIRLFFNSSETGSQVSHKSVTQGNRAGDKSSMTGCYNKSQESVKQ